MMIIIMTKPGEGTLVLERGQRMRGCSGNPSCSGLAEVDHHDHHDDDNDDDGDGETANLVINSSKDQDVQYEQ